MVYETELSRLLYPKFLQRYTRRELSESDLQLAFETGKRREQIAVKIQDALVKLSNNTNNRINLPEEERPTVANVINASLLGHLPDETLLLDIFPRANQNKTRGRVETNPLWTVFSDQLTHLEKSNAFTAFRTFEKLCTYIDTRADVRQPRIATLDLEQLQTVGDARKITIKGWNSIAGYSNQSAIFMFDSFKKIEIPHSPASSAATSASAPGESAGRTA
jgi:hypothetical protein